MNNTERASRAVELMAEYQELKQQISVVNSMLATFYDAGAQFAGLVDEPVAADVPAVAAAMPLADEFMSTAVESIHLQRRLAAVTAELQSLVVVDGDAPLAALRMQLGYGDVGPAEFERLFPESVTLAAIRQTRDSNNLN